MRIGVFGVGVFRIRILCVGVLGIRVFRVRILRIRVFGIRILGVWVVRLDSEGRLVAQHAYASPGSVPIAPHAWGTVRVACAVLAGDDPAELISDIARVRSKSEVRCDVRP